jgi:hypothetical protein
MCEGWLENCSIECVVGPTSKMLVLFRWLPVSPPSKAVLSVAKICYFGLKLAVGSPFHWWDAAWIFLEVEEREGVA